MTVLLVYRRVRTVPSKRRAEGIRCRVVVVNRRTPVLAVGQTGTERIRSRGDWQPRLPNHWVPTHVFRGREFRRRQRQTDVSMIIIWFLGRGESRWKLDARFPSSFFIWLCVIGTVCPSRTWSRKLYSHFLYAFQSYPSIYITSHHLLSRSSYSLPPFLLSLSLFLFFLSSKHASTVSIYSSAFGQLMDPTSYKLVSYFSNHFAKLF